MRVQMVAFGMMVLIIFSVLFSFAVMVSNNENVKQGIKCAVSNECKR